MSSVQRNGHQPESAGGSRPTLIGAVQAVSMVPAVHRLALVGTLALLLVSGSQAASGADAPPCDTEWAAAVSGNWAGASNWTNGVPDETKSACIVVPGDYTVTVTEDARATAISNAGT